MKNLLKISISIMLCVSLCLLSGCSNNQKASVINTGKYKEISGIDCIDSGIAYENDRFILKWDDNKKLVIIEDKLTGKLYSSTPSDAIETKFDADGMMIKNNPQVDSPIFVYYYSPKTLTVVESLSYVDAYTDGGIYAEKIKNGIRVTYDFLGLEISVPVEYTVDDDSFNATVIAKDIKDNGKKYVTGVAISPFICSVKNDAENSYLFYPDGSGTLLDTSSVNLVGKHGEMHIYGNDATVQSYEMQSYKKQINMPVFGCKNNDTAVLGVITSGAEQASMCWSVGSTSLKYSAVYPKFLLRGYNLVHAPSGFAAAEADVQTFDDAIQVNNPSVKYFVLNGEDADYCGMAKTYQKYLVNKNKLKKTSNDTSLSIKIMGGVQTKAFSFGVPYTKLFKLSTVNETKDMLSTLKKGVKGKITANLIGFGKSGVNIGEVGGGYKISGSFGNKKSVSELINYSKNNNINLFYNFDMLAYKESGSGFSLSKDSATQPNGQSAHNVTKDNVTRKEGTTIYRLLSRKLLGSAFDKAKKSSKDYGFSGFSIGSLSNVIYSDYGVNGANVCGNMPKQISDLIKKQRKTGKIMTVAGNDYAVAMSNFAQGIPLNSSNLDVSKTDIPFFSMVFKGYVPMSSEDINASSNKDLMILRCAECGITPQYLIVKNMDNTLVSSDIPGLYGASFDGMKNEITDSSNKLSKVIKNTAKATVLSHKVLDNGLHITKFSNNFFVVTNETDCDIEYSGRMIKAKDFSYWSEK